MLGLKRSSLAQSYTRCLVALWILQSSQILGQNADNFDVGFSWVRADVREWIPFNAVVGGFDGPPIYVGRAYHGTNLFPAKVLPGKKIAYVSYNGTEYPKYQLEVLITRASYKWAAAANGDVPVKALIGGFMNTGENLYIGRAAYNGSLTVGKVQPSKKGLLIPYHGKEVFFAEYEVLVKPI